MGTSSSSFSTRDGQEKVRRRGSWFGKSQRKQKRSLAAYAQVDENNQACKAANNATEEDNNLSLPNTYKEPLLSSCAGPDGEFFSFSESGTALSHDATTGQVTREWKAHERSITCATCSNDNNRLVTASRDLCIKIWDPSSSSETACIPDAHQLSISSLVCSDQLIASGSRDTYVKTWDLARVDTPTFSAHLPRNLVTCLAFADVGNHGSLLVQGSEDLALRCWDFRRTSQPVLTLQGYTYFATCAGVSPCEPWVLVTGTNGFESSGCEVFHWDLRKVNAPVNVLVAHSSAVVSCFFVQQACEDHVPELDSGQSKWRAISVAKDKQVVEWDLVKGDVVKRYNLPLQGPCTSVSACGTKGFGTSIKGEYTCFEF